MPTKNTNKKYYNLGRVKNCVCLCYQILIKHECRVPAKSIIIGHRLSMVHCHSIRWRSVRHSISALNWIVVAANLLSTCPTPGNINGGNRRGGRSLPFFEFLTPFPVTSRIRNGDPAASRLFRIVLLAAKQHSVNCDGGEVGEADQMLFKLIELIEFVSLEQKPLHFPEFSLLCFCFSSDGVHL